MGVGGKGAIATGIGSMPGTDVAAALRLVVEQLPDFPHWPELPAAGPHRGIVGRAAGILVDLPLQLRAGRWTTAGRAGVDQVRAQRAWDEDLVIVASLLAGADVPFKVGVCGPWTLLAQIESATGRALLTDRGAVRDVTTSLAAGIVDLRTRLAAAAPGLRFVIQLDEPLLAAVVGGTLPDAGWGRLPAVESELVSARLAEVLGDAPDRLIHCCAAQPPLAQMWAAGATGVSVDLSLLGPTAEEPLGQALEAGKTLLAGVVEPSRLSYPISSVGDVSGRSELASITQLLHQLGIQPESVAGQLVVTPTCGLAGVPAPHVADVLHLTGSIAEQFAELAGEGGQ
jgi:hypothetical protein